MGGSNNLSLSFNREHKRTSMITLFPSWVFRIKFDLITSQERPLLHLGLSESAALDWRHGLFLFKNKWFLHKTAQSFKRFIITMYLQPVVVLDLMVFLWMLVLTAAYDPEYEIRFNWSSTFKGAKCSILCFLKTKTTFQLSPVIRGGCCYLSTSCSPASAAKCSTMFTS